MIDTPRVRKQTRHFSSVKEDEMLEFSELESDDDEPSKPSSKPRRPQDKAQGYPRSECFRVEKNLLVYGSVTHSCFLPAMLTTGLFTHITIIGAREWNFTY